MDIKYVDCIVSWTVLIFHPTAFSHNNGPVDFSPQFLTPYTIFIFSVYFVYLKLCVRWAALIPSSVLPLSDSSQYFKSHMITWSMAEHTCGLCLPLSFFLLPFWRCASLVKHGCMLQIFFADQKYWIVFDILQKKKKNPNTNAVCLY